MSKRLPGRHLQVIRITLVASLYIVLGVLEVDGQSLHRGNLLDAIRSSSESRALRLYTSQCPDDVPDACDVYSYPILSRSCAVAGIDSLEAGDSFLLLVHYLNKIAYQETEDQTWLCESDAAVLLEGTDAKRAVPVWQDSAERTIEFIRPARHARHAAVELVSIPYCLNGTGGCSDNLLLRRDGVWQFVERDSTWDRIYSQLPAGYRLHKSPYIDLEKLTWEEHIAGPKDPNCCPSGRLFLDLDLVGNYLTVTKARLEADLDPKP